MIFLVNFFAFLMITIVTPARISGHENQAQTLNYPGLDPGVSNVQVSIGNSECRTCKSSNEISYLLGSQKVTWFQAYVLCKQSGMDLAEINSKEEEIALENYAKSFQLKTGLYEGYWLAGTRHGSCSSDFVWLNTGKPVIYRNFAQGQPDNAGTGEPCIHLFLNEQNTIAWNDIGCDEKLGFICQSSKSCV